MLQLALLLVHVYDRIKILIIIINMAIYIRSIVGSKVLRILYSVDLVPPNLFSYRTLSF